VNDGSRLEGRIRVEPDGSVIAMSGKVEFGQGIRTGFAQIVADELDVPIERVRVVLADTAQVPVDWGTFGSHSTEQEAPRLRRAAAFARQQLLERAAAFLGVPAQRLDTDAGLVRDGEGKSVTYADLVRDAPLEGAIPEDVPLRPPERWRYIGRPRPSVDAGEIVTGRARYAADVRLPGMLRGAIARPPVRGATVRSVNDSAVRAMPGVAAVIHDGDLVGVVADREEQARAAVDALDIDWQMPAPADGGTVVLPIHEEPGVDDALARAARRIDRTYVCPPIANAPIGPSAAVADVRDGEATVWGSTHRPFSLRDAVAGRLGLPKEKVRFILAFGSGTYGRSSSFDAPMEAAILSARAKRPVLVQWSRAEEFQLSPSRPEAVLEASVALDPSGTIAAWRYDEHTNVHTSSGFDPRHAAESTGRNADPPYRIPVRRVMLHVEPTPLRTANFRSLAASENVFAIESLMDELAHEVGQDPLAFRLRHLDDARLRRVLERTAERADWGKPRGDRRGLGIACTAYHGTRVAEVAEVEVAPSGVVRVLRFWAVVDPGLVIDPDGVSNQVEGGIQQSASWTVFEQLRHKNGRVLTSGWDTYRIATFRDAPLAIEVEVASDPNEPSTGVGEPGAVPAAAAIANAVFAACGARVRELPLSPERVRGAIRP
jgi:nicotinate dehydrogenase subunit B